MAESDGIQPIPIQKSSGLTRSERFLASLCERSFLGLWSYPNPYRDDGHELCDLLAVFENSVFIFFDREKQLIADTDAELEVEWDRWKRRVIDAQVKTAEGAERYVRSGRSIFLDSSRKSPFPVDFDRTSATIHKIIVAHGAKEACLRSSPENISGSLGICYGKPESVPEIPFLIQLDRDNPVHILDSHNLPILLTELDTVADSSFYMDAKLRAVSALDFLIYCGEEDLLANYYENFDDSQNRHFIGTKDSGFNGVMIAEGEWNAFTKLDLYRQTKRTNEISYLWDHLIQKTAGNALHGTLLGDPAFGRGPIQEMAKEPRFSRRSLSEHMVSSMRNFPASTEILTRYMSFMPSFYTGKAYVFLQLWASDRIRAEADYRAKRRTILEIACGAAKNAFPEMKSIVGIGMDAPKHAKKNSEDFLLLECGDWTESQRKEYQDLNEGWNFFRSPNLRAQKKKVKEFVDPSDLNK